jgi:hypothetical protein
MLIFEIGSIIRNSIQDYLYDYDELDDGLGGLIEIKLKEKRKNSK